MQPALVVHDRQSAVGDEVGAVEGIQLFELLDRVGLDADAHGLRDDLGEVHEQPLAQHRGEFGLARAVSGREPGERRRLVVAEVIHAHVLEPGLATSLCDEVDQCDQRRALGLWRVGPEGLVLRGAVRVDPRKAVQVFQSFLAAIRMSLDVVEQVPGVRQGKEVEPAPVTHGKQELDSRECTRVVRLAGASVVLESRLSLQLAQRVDFQAVDDEVVVRRGESGERRDACLDEGLAVGVGEPGDEGEVVGLAPGAVAVLVPATDRAEVDGDRLRRSGEAVEYGLLEVALDASVVGGDFVQANRDSALLDGTRDDVDEFGFLALDLSEVFGVRTQLEDRIHLGDAGELGVFGFERERIDGHDEVGATDPRDAVVVVAKERRLVERVATLGERLLRLLGAIAQGIDGVWIGVVALRVQVDHAVAEFGDGLRELHEVLLLVLLSVLAQDVGELVLVL